MNWDIYQLIKNDALEQTSITSKLKKSTFLPCCFQKEPLFFFVCVTQDYAAPARSARKTESRTAVFSGPFWADSTNSSHNENVFCLLP